MFSMCERRLCAFGPAISTLINMADELKTKASADWTCQADKEAMRLSVNAIEVAERIMLQRFSEVIQDKLDALYSQENTVGDEVMKCQTIDRLALTRQKFPHMYGEEPVKEHREGYSTCPSCGQETLIHEDGCEHCRSCGWSACG